MMGSVLAPSGDPTPAETSDVANAVFDGADMIVLTAETAIGARSVEAVTNVGLIASEAENHFEEQPPPLG